MNDQQFNTYARFYDLLYKDKDYAGEAAYIHGLIKTHTAVSIKELSILDLACGTGKHLSELYKIGYRNLVGSDISSQMVAVARERTALAKQEINFHNFSFQDSQGILPAKFNVVMSMFSAVNYITRYEEQLQSFRNIYSLLKDDGLLLFDYWNGNAVVRDYSPVKVLRKKDGNAEIMRISNTEIDRISQDVRVKFNCLYFEGDRKVHEFEELHHLHYYHFSEMFNLLKTSGFRVLHTSPFLEPAKEAGPFDWNISIVAAKNV